MLSIFNFSTDYATDNSMNLVKVGAYKALLRSEIQTLPINYFDVFESLKYSITKMYVFSYQILSESLHRPIEDYMKGCGDYGAIFCSSLHLIELSITISGPKMLRIGYCYLFTLVPNSIWYPLMDW